MMEDKPKIINDPDILNRFKSKKLTHYFSDKYMVDLKQNIYNAKSFNESPNQISLILDHVIQKVEVLNLIYGHFNVLYSSNISTKSLCYKVKKICCTVNHYMFKHYVVVLFAILPDPYLAYHYFWKEYTNDFFKKFLNQKKDECCRRTKIAKFEIDYIIGKKIYDKYKKIQNLINRSLKFNHYKLIKLKHYKHLLSKPIGNNTVTFDSVSHVTSPDKIFIKRRGKQPKTLLSCNQQTENFNTFKGKIEQHSNSKHKLDDDKRLTRLSKKIKIAQDILRSSQLINKKYDGIDFDSMEFEDSSTSSKTTDLAELEGIPEEALTEMSKTYDSIIDNVIKKYCYDKQFKVSSVGPSKYSSVANCKSKLIKKLARGGQPIHASRGRPRLLKNMIAKLEIMDDNLFDSEIGQGKPNLSFETSSNSHLGSLSQTSDSNTLKDVVTPYRKTAKEEIPHFERIIDNVYTYDDDKNIEKSVKKQCKRMVCSCSLDNLDLNKPLAQIQACGGDCLNRILMMECGSRCPCSDYCTNRQFQKRQYCFIEPFMTFTKGWGLRTLQDMEPGNFIIEYVGEVIDTKEFLKRQKHYHKQERIHYYFMSLKQGQIIDATNKGSYSRFINHSCDPNCETQKWTVNGKLRIGIFAKKRIPKYSELTFDYKSQRYGREPQKCYCGSSNCRGYIDKSYLPIATVTPIQQHSTNYSSGTYNNTSSSLTPGSKKNALFIEDPYLEEEISELYRSCNLFETDETLNVQIAKNEPYKCGLSNSDHVIKFCRMIIRIEKCALKIKLLKILKYSRIDMYEMFVNLQGLNLLWTWMASIPEFTEDNYVLLLDKTFANDATENKILALEIMNILYRLPTKDKDVLEKSKIPRVLDKWTNIPLSVQNYHPELARLREDSIKLLEFWRNIKEEFKIPKKREPNILEAVHITKPELEQNHLALPFENNFQPNYISVNLSQSSNTTLSSFPSQHFISPANLLHANFNQDTFKSPKLPSNTNHNVEMTPKSEIFLREFTPPRGQTHVIPHRPDGSDYNNGAAQLIQVLPNSNPHFNNDYGGRPPVQGSFEGGNHATGYYPDELIQHGTNNTHNSTPSSTYPYNHNYYERDGDHRYVDYDVDYDRYHPNQVDKEYWNDKYDGCDSDRRRRYRDYSPRYSRRSSRSSRYDNNAENRNRKQSHSRCDDDDDDERYYNNNTKLDRYNRSGHQEDTKSNHDYYYKDEHGDRYRPPYSRHDRSRHGSSRNSRSGHQRRLMPSRSPHSISRSSRSPGRKRSYSRNRTRSSSRTRVSLACKSHSSNKNQEINITLIKTTTDIRDETPIINAVTTCSGSNINPILKRKRKSRFEPLPIMVNGGNAFTALKAPAVTVITISPLLADVQSHSSTISLPKYIQTPIRSIVPNSLSTSIFVTPPAGPFTTSLITYVPSSYNSIASPMTMSPLVVDTTFKNTKVSPPYSLIKLTPPPSMLHTSNSSKILTLTTISPSKLPTLPIKTTPTHITPSINFLPINKSSPKSNNVVVLPPQSYVPVGLSSNPQMLGLPPPPPPGVLNYARLPIPSLQPGLPFSFHPFGGHVGRPLSVGLTNLILTTPHPQPPSASYNASSMLSQHHPAIPLASPHTQTPAPNQQVLIDIIPPPEPAKNIKILPDFHTKISPHLLLESSSRTATPISSIQELKEINILKTITQSITNISESLKSELSTKTSSKLPPHWKMAFDASSGKPYYYHKLTKKVQWEPPSDNVTDNNPQISNISNFHIQDEKLNSVEQPSTSATFESNPEKEVPPLSVEDVKEKFRHELSAFVVQYLRPYLKKTCEVGRICNNDDFKYLARKLTHTIMGKELERHSSNPGSIRFSSKVRAKSELFMETYMEKLGPIYIKK